MGSKSSGHVGWVCPLQQSRKRVRNTDGQRAAEALDIESCREMQKVVRQTWSWYTRSSRWNKA